MPSIRDQILAATKGIEKVSVPELGGIDVYLRRMTGAEREVYVTARDTAKATGEELSRVLLAFCICDECGKRQFEKQEELRDMDCLAIDRLTTYALDMNILTKEALEALQKKLPSVRNASISGLPKSAESPGGR
jgi:hypothetical protein